MKVTVRGRKILKQNFMKLTQVYVQREKQTCVKKEDLKTEDLCNF